MEGGHHTGKGGKGQGPRAVYDRSGAVFDQGPAFSGLSKDKGEIMSLLEFVGKELEKDTYVQKQFRKAEEGHLFAQKEHRGGKKKEED